MNGNLHILIVEDQATDAELCEEELRRAGLEFSSERVYSREAFEIALARRAPDVILSDFSMPSDLDGFLALSIARERTGGVPFVFVSGTIGEERAVAAMKAGATDYVLKDKLDRLGPVVKRALQEARDRRSMLEAQNALKASEATFRSFMQHVPGRASIRDLAGRYTYVNEAWTDAFDLKAEDVIGRPCDEVWSGKRAEALRQTHQRVLSDNAPMQRVIQRGTRWWLAHQFPVPDAEGRPFMVGTIAIDVTEQKLQEQKLARLGRIHAVLSGFNSAVVRMRQRGKLLEEACRIAVEEGGFRAAWVGLRDTATGEVKPFARSGLVDGSPSVVLPLRGSAGVIGEVSLLAAEPELLAEDELRLLMQLAHDISFALEYIDKEEKLAYLAWHDPLTGLGNRPLLHEQLSDALQVAMLNDAAVAVLVWDVQRFRTINDSYGRETGDALLRELAARAGELWPELAHIARLSADYFAGFIVKARDASDIAHLLEESKAALNAPFVVDGKEILVGISIGIACYPHDGGDADTLLNNAEAALKQAKMRGEHYLFYETAMNSRVAEKLSLESKLRGALDKDQFVLHYQPKIDLATNEMSGLEALIRWNDPETGLVPPMDFIPLLEETGLILDVGRWAIRKALEDWKTRQARGLATPRIAVNVSSMQLRRADFVSSVEKVLAEVCGARHALDLEITESVIMEDIEGNTGKLHALKAMGVNIAIDDFGTGYSSLSYLAKLPMDALKIDRGFIMTMVREPQSMTIVSTIISLAHALRMVVVAEGVESDEQAILLRRLHCEQAQGFFFSRPVPWAEAFTKEPAGLPPA